MRTITINTKDLTKPAPAAINLHEECTQALMQALLWQGIDCSLKPMPAFRLTIINGGQSPTIGITACLSRLALATGSCWSVHIKKEPTTTSSYAP